MKNHRPLGGRQWNIASTAVTTSISMMSSSGYASVVSTAAELPPVTREDRADDGGRHRADREAADGAVQPEAQRYPVGDVANDEEECDECQGTLEGQPQRVCERGERLRVHRPDEDRPIDVAHAIDREADREDLPAGLVRRRACEPGPSTGSG